MRYSEDQTRRKVLGLFALAPAFFLVPGRFADELVATPRQTEGPFFPDRLPLDTDNDLVILGDRLTPAVGEITNLSGRVLDVRGEPIRNARVEIWQVDHHGSYLHTHGANPHNGGKRDGNFQGYGKFETGADGGYRFRTIKPVRYPGRTPHIHMAVTVKGRDRFATQCYVKGEPLNERDGVLNAIRDRRQRESVVVAFEPVPSSRIKELRARMDIVLGFTPSM